MGSGGMSGTSSGTGKCACAASPMSEACRNYMKEVCMGRDPPEHCAVCEDRPGMPSPTCMQAAMKHISAVSKQCKEEEESSAKPEAKSDDGRCSCKDMMSKECRTHMQGACG